MRHNESILTKSIDAPLLWGAGILCAIGIAVAASFLQFDGVAEAAAREREADLRRAAQAREEAAVYRQVQLKLALEALGR